MVFQKTSSTDMPCLVLKKLKISINIQPIDWLSFNQIYKPILGLKTSSIYENIYYQKQIFNQLNISSYRLDEFLQNLKISLDNFKTYLGNLSDLNLVSLSLKNNEDGSVDYLVHINSPLNSSEALKNEEIKNKLKESVTEYKYEEISLLSEEKAQGHDLELSSHKNCLNLEDSGTSRSSIAKHAFYEFYGAIFHEVQKTFQVSPEIIELITTCYSEEKTLTLKQCKDIGIKSLRQKNKDFWYIDDKLFESLVDIELNQTKSTKNQDDYENFWINLLEKDNSGTKLEFHKLFSEINTEDFYKFISEKNNIPIGINKWIDDCTKNKGFSFEILNAMISFVKTLLKKLPINYLIKMSDSIYDNNLMDLNSFISHIKSVLEHDIQNKNRLNIQNIKTGFETKSFR